MACRRNTYLWRHPTNTSPTVSNRSYDSNKSSAADNAIFKNRAQNIQCCFGCVARSAVLLKPNYTNTLLFNFYEHKFVQHGPITIDCNGHSLFIFEEKCPNYAYGLKSAPNKLWLVLGASAFQCMRAGFSCTKCDNFACLHTRQNQTELHLKRWFFFCQNQHLL